MMVYCQAVVLWAVAFDNDGKIDSSRNEFAFEDLGWMPDEVVESLGRERYAKAVSYKILKYSEPPHSILDLITTKLSDPAH